MDMLSLIRGMCTKGLVKTAVALTLPAVWASGAWSGVTAPPDIVTIQSSLKQRLDSIDVEKQIRKRKGLALDDLEKSAAAIKDSIAALRASIEKRGESFVVNRPALPLEATDRTARPIQKYIPHTIFDWVILIVGAIAIIAGVILCIGIFSMVFGKIRSKRRSPDPPLPSGRPAALTDTPVGHASALAALKSEIAEHTIETLRKRIGDQQEAPAPPASGAVDITDMKKNIIEAARQGASIAEISKRFHISTDHVSLIVRLAQKEGEARL